MKRAAPILLIACVVVVPFAGCSGGDSGPEVFPDIEWWDGVEPDGDCALPEAADAAGVYFVAPGGDDDAAGTMSAPWGTVQKATESLSAGDTVFIRSGSYGEQLIPGVSGAPGAWITYAAFPAETAILDGADLVLGPSSGLVEIEDREFVRICGMRVQNVGPDRNANGILVSSSRDLVIGDNSTYDTASSGIGVWASERVVIVDNEVEMACNAGEQECITVAQTSNFVVRGNEVHHNGLENDGGEGIDVKDGSFNGAVHDNHVHELTRLGIYVEAWDKHTHNIFIFNNESNDNYGAEGITLATEMGGLLQNVRVYNNLIHDNGCAGIGLSFNNEDPGVPRHPMQTIEILNNTVVGNGSDDCSGARWGGGIEVGYDDIRDVVIRNNLTSDNLVHQIWVDPTFSRAELEADHNLIEGFRGELDGELAGAGENLSGDPLFVDAANADYHLSAGSPAIDAGSAALAPQRDFAGQPRPLGAAVDVGAYEQ